MPHLDSPISSEPKIQIYWTFWINPNFRVMYLDNVKSSFRFVFLYPRSQQILILIKNPGILNFELGFNRFWFHDFPTILSKNLTNSFSRSLTSDANFSWFLTPESVETKNNFSRSKKNTEKQRIQGFQFRFLKVWPRI